MKYVAVDGKYFDRMEDCIEYEEKYLARQEEKEKRAKEVKEAYNKYRKLFDKYEKDYGVGNELRYFKSLFDI